MPWIDYSELIEEVGVEKHHFEELSQDDEGHLIIDKKTREIYIPNGSFNTTVAVVDDINANIITFEAPRYVDGHDLSACQKIYLKWINNTSKEKDSTIITVKEEKVLEESFFFDWVIPKEATTQAGTLSIAIVFEDELEIEEAGPVLGVFKWNTLPFTSLRVAPGLDGAATRGIPSNKILTLDPNTRVLLFPPNFNKTIGVTGDFGHNKLYFYCNSILDGFDLTRAINSNLEASANDALLMAMRWKNNKGESGISYEVTIADRNWLSGDNSESSLLLVWDIPAKVFEYPGELQVAFSVMAFDHWPSPSTITASWNSQITKGLSVGQGMSLDDLGYNGDNSGLSVIDEEALNAMLQEIYGQGGAV